MFETDPGAPRWPISFRMYISIEGLSPTRIREVEPLRGSPFGDLNSPCSFNLRPAALKE